MTKDKSDSKTSIYGGRASIKDRILNFIVYVSAGITIFSLLSLIAYILFNGLPYLSLKFVTTAYSESSDSLKGILPMIINTIYIIVITLAISVPIGVSCAVYLTQYAERGRLVKIIRFATETLAGIPSIIFGLFGYAVFCVGLGFGTSILSGCLTAAICVLPVIIRTTEEALISVPKSYEEGAVALGAGKLRVVLGIVLPCAFPGIVTSVILSVGRIVGESAAFIYTSGMAYKMPKGLFSHVFSSGRTLTLHLYRLAKQADTEDAFGMAFATASVLLIIVLIINSLASFISRKVAGNK